MSYLFAHHNWEMCVVVPADNLCMFCYACFMRKIHKLGVHVLLFKSAHVCMTEHTSGRRVFFNT